MSEGATASNLADLKEDIHSGERKSSSRSNDEEHASTISPEMDAVSKETQAIEVGRNDEPGPQGVVAKIVSRTISRISIDPGPPPDGGLTAWTRKL